jgi:hypothetical protein
VSNLWKLIAVAIGAVLVACQWTPPRSSALEEARRAYNLARADPLVAAAARSELYEAQSALRRAERSWIERHDDALTSHLAYLAFQRVVLARNVGLQREAEQRLERAEARTRSLLAREAPPALAETRVVPVHLPPPGSDAPAPAVPEASVEPARSEATPATNSSTLQDGAAPAQPPAPDAAQPPTAPAPEVRPTLRRFDARALPPPVQARLGRPERHIAPRHNERSRLAQSAPQRDQRVVAAQHGRGTGGAVAAGRKRALALTRHAEKKGEPGQAQQLAAGQPEPWHLAPQGRPFVVPPLNPPRPVRWLSSNGRSQPVAVY